MNVVRILAGHVLLLGGVLLVGCGHEAVLVTTDVGEAEACEDLSSWPADATAAEDSLLAAINAARRVGGTCGEAPFPPALDLAVSPQLRCASRMHAADLAGGQALGHTGSDDSDPLERSNLAGYEGYVRSELLAIDYLIASQVVAAWLASPDHCAALLAQDLDEAGAGAASNDDATRIGWVLLTGALRPE